MQHLGPDLTGNLWISDGENIFLVEKNGEVKCAFDCEGDGSCHVVTDAGKLVYLKGKKMEQYDPIIKRRLSLHSLKTSHLVIRFV